MSAQARGAKRLAGKAAVVTGGSRGNGAAICERFVEEGAAVVIGDIDRDGGEWLAGKLAQSDATFEYLDVTNEDSVREVLDRTVSRLGSLDIIVNNAGLQERLGALEEMSLEDWSRVVSVNLTGVFLCTKHALRHMKPERSGVIINMGSGGAGIRAFPGVAAYSASKGGVTNLTRAAALEVADEGIRVNCICPGNIDTPLMDRIVEQLDAQGVDGRRFVAEMHPMNRLGTPREVADAAVFLASDESSFITGTPLLVDGGYNAGAHK